MHIKLQLELLQKGFAKEQDQQQQRQQSGATAAAAVAAGCEG
jgi:hypothetical protein